MTDTKKIVVLAGDGIGEEIMASGLAVLDAVADRYGYHFDLDPQPFGGAGIDASGHPYPKATQEALHQADAILLGAIGAPQYENCEVTPEAGLLAMRKDLGLFANYRPVKVGASLADLSPLKADRVRGADFVVVRELTGGAYFGDKVEGTDYASDLMPYRREEVERIARKAFELAQSRRKHLTSVDKANVLASSRLWRHTVEAIKDDYPEVTVNHLYVDAAAMKIVTQPQAFDVILTENLFGDILSDEASVLSGSLGMQASASHGTVGPSLYEPIHGSAPDIAGQNIANPMSMILSVTMMLRQSFGYNEAADFVEACAEDLMAKGIKTKDLGGEASTTAFTQALLDLMKGAK
ncbi:MULTISPECIES: 3-isopropylmalate dehydrogenase [Aerococcus]|uniref:3-isopropylmalate dehydrogenase n=1 Tax=Aerococcus sanguinicola TaxID=119206 RepID=A0A5N1GKM3_9LACT|nr:MULTISPECIES: 3-isopropylmalate dehydrogenase [Aerococcus]KAA9300838.1 3-isopropylmalate dehydrogenase [Aerococcus sanguinicola]MDK6369373.1 3-isopropylmalate dehydrogenase [Aerococcus sp. UMB9870]MDK6679874.1 3-isopropylmalate dehydrogenase [Aerococcus sp. UMB8608]MDK6687608.1 3-isopropylmalate dehydrogenase [Aerococcus sp. UMB8623]MDK6939796.1 3-isopropylmalate dehydrogenase [Aerococcus sp. UMB8487]